MNILEDAKAMVLELYASLCSKIGGQPLEKVVDVISRSNRLFLAGTGCSEMILRVFANRLVHLGFQVGMIGDLISPVPKKGDIILFSSKSGENPALLNAARKARLHGIKMVVITASPESTLAKMADLTVLLPGELPEFKNIKQAGLAPERTETLFELLSFLIYDVITASLMKKRQPEKVCLK
ncbi:SIS domain-containing protein [Heyndrickxia coagulans]|uniref:SIS domain-containing protein n=2 Tax=Heyndrickxia coagulans TaxID=1398 RepID=UPI002E1AC069|nr:SIS domain-containing protein [Heyndrickxia coagulans]MED4965541.1 SIS domain-containing protein [Heyndrickxia coagulans]